MKILIALLAVTMLSPAAGLFSDRRAPGFSLADSKFRQHDPQDYRGKVVLVDIMLTSCPTCSKLADTLVAVKKKYGEKIAIISVVTLPDNFAAADAFAAQHGITWPIVFDSGQMIASYLEVTPSNPRVEFPHLFVIDGAGMIRSDFGESDGNSLTADGISAAIDKAAQLSPGR